MEKQELIEIQNILRSSRGFFFDDEKYQTTTYLSMLKAVQKTAIEYRDDYNSLAAENDKLKLRIAKLESNTINLKFYEFTGEYYALIKAYTKEEAIAYYKKIVCDIDSPVIQVSMQYAWEKFKPEIGELTIEDFVENIVDILLVDTNL
ncbi:hypothetical protein BMT55_16070 [Listeria newyorkensis]|uniref:Uncharacterized protein n=1 Tax=Listeria newyorkensis TaxID=1497681 RepID=A0ABX4XIG9_9LIST|nr:hypothetical protein [Listeria newyorkensis]PNP87439.1 hypothetical protein BMT55_16070 [Listeria newyorkensis]